MTVLGTRRDTAENDETPSTAGRGLLERLFKITERGSTTGREIRGGLVTFFAMAYIVILNPLILGAPAPRTPPPTSRAAGSRRRRWAPSPASPPAC